MRKRDSSELGAEPDERLLRRLGAGDTAAFAVLARRHGPRVHALAHRVLASSAEAEDVAQEVFVRLWQQGGRWEARGARLSTWLHRVTVNLCLNLIERVHRRIADVDVMRLEIAAEDEPLEDHLAQAERARVLQAAIARLPPQQRAALALFYTADATTAEAASVLGLSVKATESLLVRARQNLRRALGKLLETPA